MPQNVPLIPTPQTKPSGISSARAGQLIQKLTQQLQQIQKADSIAQKLGKLGEVLGDLDEYVLIIDAIGSVIKVVKDLTGIAVDLQVLFDDPMECICQALTCLNEQVNASQFGRQARYEMDKEKLQALMLIANAFVIGGKINRQGFQLDECGQGWNDLESQTFINRELKAESADQKLGGCVAAQDIGE